MTQDKWFPHICQVSESKCETRTIPFSPELPLHSPSFPHICSTIRTSVMPCVTLYKLQLSNHPWHASLLCLGCRTPKQKGRFSPKSQFYQKHLLLSPWIKTRYIEIHPGRLYSWNTTHRLSSAVHTQCSSAYISQICGKSGGPLPIIYLYFSFCHFHWHEQSSGTRITFSFSMACTEERGSSSAKDVKCFHTFITTNSFFHPVDPSCTKPSL